MIPFKRFCFCFLFEFPDDAEQSALQVICKSIPSEFQINKMASYYKNVIPIPDEDMLNMKSFSKKTKEPRHEISGIQEVFFSLQFLNNSLV